MKKIIIIFIIFVVLVALSLAGVLYGTQDRSDEGAAVALEQIYMNQYSVPMPEVIFTANNLTF